MYGRLSDVHRGFDDVPSGIDIDDAYGFDAWAGYRFSDLLSAELNLESLNGFDFSFLGVDVDGQALTSTVNAESFPLARVVRERPNHFHLPVCSENSSAPFKSCSHRELLGRIAPRVSMMKAADPRKADHLSFGRRPALDWAFGRRVSETGMDAILVVVLDVIAEQAA